MKQIFYKAFCWMLILTYTFVFVVQDVTLSWAMHSGSSDSASNFSSDFVQVSAAQNFQTDLFTGQATTSIPIFVPPGRKGIQPSLGLTYSSFGGNGWVGVGWSLDMGFIQRSTKNGPPRYTMTDAFLVSFQGVQSELVYVSGNEYRAKNESGAFLKFEFDGTSWDVWDKNGVVYSFGATSASRLEFGGDTFKWHLDRITDLHGNYLEVSYQKRGNQTYLWRVAYTGHDPTSTPPTHTVEFLREARNDDILDLLSGQELTIDERLSQIDVKTDGALVRRYLFEYPMSPRTNRSILKRVREYGSDGDSQLPPIEITYYSENDVTFTFQTEGGVGSSDNAWNIQTAQGDRFSSNESVLLPNGDGRCRGSVRRVRRSLAARPGLRHDDALRAARPASGP